MNIYLCFDDTDNKESIGTGRLLEQFASQMESHFQAKTQVISRHQLYVHEDIPYTSHNSSMCLEAEIKEENLKKIIRCGQDFLEQNSAIGSDPGLCVVIDEESKDFSQLIEYGKRAKEEIFTKKEAYQLAQELNVHLSEHGGTGGGVIGALAGVGLRMTGNDGRIKGKYFVELQGEQLLAKDILEQTDIDQIKTVEGKKVDSNTNIYIGYKMKGIWLEYQNTLLIEQKKNNETGQLFWETIAREKVQKY